MFKKFLLPTLAVLAIVAASFPPALGAKRAVPTPAPAPTPAPPPPSEQIESFVSDLAVNPDSTLSVHETITVYSLGVKIKHGICRDIATRYNDRFSNPYTIHFDVVSVQRDGQPEDFHLGKLSNGLSVCMGDRRETLAPGDHTYELTYNVDRELGFFPDHDELYWNVTGNRWTLPLQSVVANVHLPKGIVPVAIIPDAYTGRPGAAETDFTASTDNNDTTTFRTNRVLGPLEGLTIVVRWPKGFVSPPTDEMKHSFFLEDNRPLITAILGLVLVLGYYLAIWFLAARGAHHGESGAPSDPPHGFSPAALRYVWRGAFDQKVVIVNLVDLAIKKQLAILEDASGGFILGRLRSETQAGSRRRPAGGGQASGMTPDERRLVQTLFVGGETLQLEPTQHALVGGALEALHQQVRTKLEIAQFIANARYLLPGLLISLATVVRCGYLIQGAQPTAVLLLALGLLFGGMMGFALVAFTVESWKYALSDPQHGPSARTRAMIMTAISVPFIIAEIAGFAAMSWAASAEVTIIFLLLVAINFTFHILLRGPERTGRALAEQVEEFRKFLSSTEQERRSSRIARSAMPTVPAFFEKLLPYAMALNVEKVWCEKFASSLASTQGKALDYSPTWYNGPAWDRITPGTFGNSLANSFTSAIAAASSAPGSRRGSRPAKTGGGR